MISRLTKRICLFGASPDTGNLGVSALCHAVVEALARHVPAVEVTVFDEGTGVRSEAATPGPGSFRFARCGATQTRRLWQQRSLWNIRVARWLGGLGNPAAQRLRSADAVLDISGGDSFTDLYGARRFAAEALCKQLALEAGKPLVLLPQTYGPYHASRARATAGRIVRRAAMAWARDARSFETLKELAGPEFDPHRHRCGVDVAFGLTPRPPQVALPARLGAWLAGGRDRPVVGFNVSGLIWNDAEAARARFGLKADYRASVLGFLRLLLTRTEARVVLIPHVLTPVGHFESDPAANLAAVAALGDEVSERLEIVSPTYDQSEMKWIIGKLDWMCGTRMHATIAGLSSGVPTAAVSYSLKTQGVFETCGQGAHVADPRTCDTAEVVDRLWASWNQRDAARAALAPQGRANVLKADEQMVCILAAIGLDSRQVPCLHPDPCPAAVQEEACVRE